MGTQEKYVESPTQVNFSPSEGGEAGSSNEIVINKTLDRAYGKILEGETFHTGMLTI